MSPDASERHNTIYSPLDTSRNEIRLLEISPSDDEDALIACSLHTASLDDAPFFMPVSYVWGDQSNPQEILVDGKLFHVGQNLAQLLNTLRGIRQLDALGEMPVLF